MCGITLWSHIKLFWRGYFHHLPSSEMILISKFVETGENSDQIHSFIEYSSNIDPEPKRELNLTAECFKFLQSAILSFTPFAPQIQNFRQECFLLNVLKVSIFVISFSRVLYLSTGNVFMSIKLLSQPLVEH